MFIPPSRHAAHRGSQPQASAKAVGVVVAVATTVLGAAVSGLLTKGSAGDAGDLTAAGIFIAVAAALMGFILARVIGKQGKL
jgi:hypothetical protein